MAGLPEGWEWDYDGTRWFYKYKPTGHIQYHFPSEGDEFPDFVDDATPVPSLAPEERLESQQQIKRNASTGTNARTSTGAPAKEAGWKSRMSASARPVSSVWDDDGGADDGVFQPENFMFLGPGTYNDVSPLAEEEEEAARRVVAGGIEQRVDPAPSKGVSPVASERTTPQVANSEVNRLNVPGQAANGFVMGDFVMADPMAQAPPPAPPPEPAIHMIDSREIGQPQRFDPVGFVAEMPTNDTGRAHIEMNPEPIEMADTSVMAPVVTAVPEGYFELADTTTPVEQKSRAEENRMTVESIRQQQRLRQQQVQEHKWKQKQLDAMEQDVASRPSGEERRLKEDDSRGYQPYKPGGASAKPASARPENTKEERRMSMFQDQSIAMGARPGPSNIDHSQIPAALAPRIPPKQPLDKSKTPSPPSMAVDAGPRGSAPGVPPKVPHSQGLAHVPSVLKPARAASPAPPAGMVPGRPSPGANGQGLQSSDSGVTKYPSILRPARGRATSQPGQQPQFQPLNPGQKQGPQPGAYVPPKAGQHPASMTPSPMKQQQSNAEPQMGVQRVNTLPEQGQAGQSKRPVSMLVGAQPPFPNQHGQNPGRPMSMMPGMMTGGGFPQQGQQQAANLHQNRVQGMSSTVPPTQPAPFGAPPGEAPPDRYTTPYPPDDPKPVRQNTAPYPPDDPRPVRQNTAPYPDDEPRTLRRQSTAPYPDGSGVQTPPHNRRHSAMGGDISPDSRRASMAFSTQTPSPMESRRTSAVMSLGQSSLSPSPPTVQGSGGSGSSSGRMPPQGDPGSYFPTQNVEGQGHAIAALNKLRKKSLGRADSGKRNSLPPGQSPLGAAPPTMNPQVVNQSQPIRQAPQGGAPPQQLTPGDAFPGSPPMGPQGLGRIEEREEVANLALSRSSSRSPAHTRRSSLVSAQPSPMSSRRQSLQGAPGPEDQAESQPQGPPAPGWHKGSLPPQGMIPGQGQMVPPGQAPIQPLAPLNRNPSKGQAPPTSQIPPQGPLTHPAQMVPGGQAPPQGQAQPLRQGPPGQMPPHGQMPPAALAPLQGQFPGKGQMPPQGQGQMPPQGHNPTQGQMPPVQGQPPSGQVPLQRQSSKAQAPQNQLLPQGQVRPPQGQRPVSMQFPQGTFPGPGQPQPGPMQHQRTHSQGPPMPGGPMPPQAQALQGIPPQGMAPPGAQMLPPGQMQPGQRPMGQMQPQGQRPHTRVASQGSAPNGKMYPPVQIPQGQPQWNPNNMQSPMGRPGSVPPPATAETPKEKKWFKWLKGGSKSAAQSPVTPGPPNVSTFSVMATNRPGPTGWGAPPGMPNNMPTEQPNQYPPSGNLPPGVTPSNIDSNPIPPCHGPAPPGPSSAGPVPPGPMPLTQAPVLQPPPMPVSKTPSPVQDERPPPPQASLPVEEFKNEPLKAPSPVQSKAAAPRPEPLQIQPLQAKSPPRESAQAARPAPHSEDSGFARSPPPAERSPIPDMIHSPLSQMAPGIRDSFSDTASISTTIEVSEAQPQPVLKPQVVQVNRRSTDLQSMVDAQAVAQPLNQPSVQAIAISTDEPRYLVNERPASPERETSNFSLPSRPSTRPDPPPQEDDERSMTPAPLFSGPNSPASNKSSLPSPPMKSPPRIKQFEPAPVMAKSMPPAVEDKWAKNAAADYSGGDWGDDDEWDY